jgi:hypothetical protein
MFIAILYLAEQMFLLYHLCLAIINVHYDHCAPCGLKLLETCDPKGSGVGFWRIAEQMFLLYHCAPCGLKC